MKEIIKSYGLVHKFISYDENDNQEIVSALNGVDIEVLEGEFVAILGSNGSGKSTFAKHINALLFPTEGTLIVDKMNTSDRNNRINVRRSAGMVFQNPDNQIIAGVVEDDIGFGPENLGVPTDEIWERVDRALEAVDMALYRKSSPNRLSGGQKQRVAIAGAIAMEPKCIILDEPTAMLDPVGRKEVIKTIRQLNKEKGITILLITHHMEETIDCDRIFVMNKGKVVLCGTPKEVFKEDTTMKECGLEALHSSIIAKQLKEKGYDIADDIISREELIEAIMKL